MAKMRKINQEDLKMELKDKLLEELGITEEIIIEEENQSEDEQDKKSKTN